MKKSLLRWMNLILVLPLAASVNFARADDGFYVIAVGKRAKRTILVSPQSTQAASGTALRNAVNGIADASATNPYLVIIEPGVYDIGANSLQMKQYVDLQGSGENVTKIKGNGGNLAGVLSGANHAELRFLTVENTGGGSYAVAIYNWSSSLTMTHVTATGSGGTYNHGVYNAGSIPTMTDMTATGSGGTYNYGVYNSSSFPTMSNVTSTGSGGNYAYGVFNKSASSPTMSNVTATGSGVTSGYGVFSIGSSTPKIDHSVISGSTYTIYTDAGSSTFVGNTRLEGGAVGGPGSNTCAGVYDENYIFSASTCP